MGEAALGGAGGVWEVPVLFSQFCFKSKASLKKIQSYKIEAEPHNQLPTQLYSQVGRDKNTLL